ncbi:MAG TPA: DUF6152 family protein, partial [Gammaproteobacteria bacterium]|nr:DUF6152 family protein [Gammaproteobacteria bacterium]
IAAGPLAAASSSLMLLCSAAGAHHSSAGIYDAHKTAVVQGTVEEVYWRNPHVQFTLRGVDPAGRHALWKVEGASVAMLSRHGVSSTTLRVGDQVRVAGRASVQGLPQMYVTNLLLPNGREILMDTRVKPRWSDKVVRWSDWVKLSPAVVAEARRNARGIFRVWTTDFDLGRESLWKKSYPLTKAAMTVRAKWNQKDSPYIYSCFKGMPIIMEQPYPLEFTRLENGDIELRLEEFDTVRKINMHQNASAQGKAPTILGYSTGQWDGDTLVVSTTGISWPYFDQTGIPLHKSSVLVERFTPSEDGNRLNYTLTVTDPAIFTEPVVLKTFWSWKPGEQVHRFNCKPNGGPLKE